MGVVLAALLGAALAIGLVLYIGLDGVLRSLEVVGWSGFVLVCLAQIALFPLLGSAWAVLTPSPPIRWRAMVIGRVLRDAATEVLPFSAVGGFIIGARAAILAGASAPVVFATATADLAMEFAAQIAYVTLGLSLLAFSGPALADVVSAAPLVLGLAVALVCAVGFVLAQRFALRPLIEQIAKRTPLSFLVNADAFHDVISAIYRRPVQLGLSIGLHLLGWIASAAGAWLALRFLGHEINPVSLIELECLLYAVRSAAFFVPAGLGVQEGAYAILGPIFGVPMEIALALSLLKRARDLTIGIVALAGLQMVETRRAFAAP
ncbi:MAG: lysylphosphatidylglycerol synthase domain-containing protein [Caulobacteraceae bacterium]